MSPVPKLPDVLETGLSIVFVGTAAGNESARQGAYYAKSGNQFWHRLQETGLTPRRLHPEEFRELPLFGIGLTDLAKHVSGMDSQVASSELDVAGFRAKIRSFRPAAVAFHGKTPANAVLGRGVDWGRQRDMLEEAVVFVLPQTSRANCNPKNQHLECWEEVTRFVQGHRR